MKTIIFDFDGTLTKKHQNVWKYLWKELGYNTGKNSAQGTLFELFIRNKITYEKWVELTAYYFKKAGLNKSLLNKAIDDTVVLDGCLELFKYLKQKGYDIHIVSGGVKEVICKSIGSSIKFCTNIVSNDFIFNNNGYLETIKTTPYDYEGKALYIQKLINEKGIAPTDILFVGNSDNDEYVYKTGCHTLCINAETKNANNTTIYRCV